MIYRFIKLAKYITLISFFLMAMSVVTVFAQAPAQDISTPGQSLTVQRVVQVITSLVCFFIDVLLVLIVIVFIFFAVRYATSGGNPDAYGKAKKGLLWAFVGAIIILGTYTIIATVANAVGNTNYPIIPINCSG